MYNQTKTCVTSVGGGGGGGGERGERGERRERGGGGGLVPRDRRQRRLHQPVEGGRCRVANERQTALVSVCPLDEGSLRCLFNLVPRGLSAPNQLMLAGRKTSS